MKPIQGRFLSFQTDATFRLTRMCVALALALVRALPLTLTPTLTVRVIVTLCSDNFVGLWSVRLAHGASSAKWVLSLSESLPELEPRVKVGMCIVSFQSNTNNSSQDCLHCYLASSRYIIRSPGPLSVLLSALLSVLLGCRPCCPCFCRPCSWRSCCPCPSSLTLVRAELRAESAWSRKYVFCAEWSARVRAYLRAESDSARTNVQDPVGPDTLGGLRQIASRNERRATTYVSMTLSTITHPCCTLLAAATYLYTIFVNVYSIACIDVTVHYVISNSCRGSSSCLICSL
jgi:hypothetical protein